MKLFVEATAFGTSVGKSTFANRLADYCDDVGITNRLVRIEASDAAAPISRPQDLFIATDSFKEAARTQGGLVGQVRPLLGALEELLHAQEPSVVIVDWPGSLGRARAEILAASGLDAVLQSHYVRSISFVLSTCIPERIKEAANALRESAELAPGFEQIAVLNGRDGDFLPMTAKSGAPSTAMLAKAAPGVRLMPFPLIEADAHRVLRADRASIRAVLSGFDLDHWTAQTKENRFVLLACRAKLDAWYRLTEVELAKVLPFRPSDDTLAA